MSDLEQLKKQHERWLKFNSGASPGQVADSTSIIELLDLIAALRKACQVAADGLRTADKALNEEGYNSIHGGPRSKILRALGALSAAGIVPVCSKDGK